MYNDAYGKTNSAQKLGTLINIIGIIGFILILISMDSEMKVVLAFGSLIGNLAFGTILVTLGNIQNLLEFETIEIEED